MKINPTPETENPLFQFFFSLLKIMTTICWISLLQRLFEFNRSIFRLVENLCNQWKPSTKYLVCCGYGVQTAWAKLCLFILVKWTTISISTYVIHISCACMYTLDAMTPYCLQELQPPCWRYIVLQQSSVIKIRMFANSRVCMRLQITWM